MRKYLIYTVLVGNNYDNIIKLSSTSDDFDYICFVRKGSKTLDYINGWKIEEIEYENKDNGRLSRFPKLLPHKTKVSDYEYSLYIDANIDIKNEYVYERFKQLAGEDVPIAMLQHPFRDCVYQEAYVCIASLKGGWLDIIRQIIFLKRKRYPKHNGLFEANVIFRKHNSLDVIALDELWWSTFMKYSKRDQLSFVYSLREKPITMAYFLPQGQTTRNHPSFVKISHLAKKDTTSIKIKRSFIKMISGISRKLLKEEHE